MMDKELTGIDYVIKTTCEKRGVDFQENRVTVIKKIGLRVMYDPSPENIIRAVQSAVDDL